MGFHDSSARSREVGTELRKRRKKAALTGAELAQQLGWSPSKLSRIESGLIGVSEVDVALYLARCDAHCDGLQELRDLARAGNSDSWLQERGVVVPDALRTLALHEATAASIAWYEPMLVPGLLQTPEYAMALMDFGDVMPKSIRSHSLQVRMDRQAVLRRSDPPVCTFFVHEVGLRSRAGSNRVMHEQMLHLVFLTSRPQYAIRVVPADSGPHGIWGSAFVILTYDHHGPVVFVEGLTTSLFLEKPKDVTIFQQAARRLDRDALDVRQSRLLFEKLAGEYDVQAHESA